MRIFISWSGDQSRAVAGVLANWIPDVLLDVETWMSDHDIQAGSRWAAELGGQLENCLFGIVCLTPENSKSPWLLFEAGALSKAVGRAKVVPYLFRIKPANVEFPLAQFQSVDADQEGTFKLIESINSMREDPLDPIRLQKAFRRCWPELFESLNHISSPSPAPAERTDRELLEEILGLLRATNRTASSETRGEMPTTWQPFSWKLDNAVLNVSESDLSAMDDAELAHYRRHLHTRFRRTDSRDEEEALERQQRLASHEYEARLKRTSTTKPARGSTSA
jgi:hypothetical protein